MDGSNVPMMADPNDPPNRTTTTPTLTRQLWQKHYHLSCGFCVVFSLPFFIWLICVFVILGKLSTFNRSNNTSTAASIPGFNGITLASLTLNDLCQTTGAQFFMELSFQEELTLPLGFSLGTTTITLKHPKTNQPIASLTTVPAVGSWAPPASTSRPHLALTAPVKTPPFTRTKIGLELSIQDEETYYKLLREVAQDKRSVAKAVPSFSIAMDVTSSLHLKQSMDTVLYFHVEQPPLMFPMQTDPPVSLCQQCRAAVEREKEKKQKNTWTNKSNTSFSMGNINIVELSNKAMNFAIGIDTNGLLNITGDSAFNVELEGAVGLKEQNVGIIRFGVDEKGDTNVGIKVTQKEHEAHLISLLDMLATTSTKETITNVLPITLRKPTKETETEPNNKCMLKKTLETVRLTTTIPVVSLLRYQNLNWEQIRAEQNETTKDVCQYSNPTRDTGACLLPRPKPGGGEAPAPAPAPAPSDSSRGGFSIPNVNFNIAPNSITWLESTRSDVATLEFEWTTEQTESLIPGSTNTAASTSNNYMLESITAPIVFVEKHTETTMSLQIIGSHQDGSMRMQLSMCLGGTTCKLDSSSPPSPPPLSQSIMPTLLSHTLNGQAMNISIGLSSDSSVQMITRVLSILDLSWFVPVVNDAVRARYFDVLLAISPPDTETTAINYAKWLDSMTSATSASATHKRTLNIPSTISDLIPTIDLGTFKTKAIPYGNNSWSTPMAELTLKGNYERTLFTSVASLQTTFQFQHPLEHNALYEEYGMWSNVLQCNNHQVQMVIQHRGMNARFPWHIPRSLITVPLDALVATPPSQTLLNMYWDQTNSSLPFRSDIYMRGNPNQIPFIVQKVTVPSSLSTGTCTNATPAMEEQAKATSPKIVLNYTNPTLRQQITTIDTIVLDQWNDKLHGNYGNVNITLSPLLDVRVGGAGFIVVMFFLTIGLSGCMTCCICLCYRDGQCGTCCPGCGQDKLPFGMNLCNASIDPHGVENREAIAGFEMAAGNANGAGVEIEK